MSRLADQLGRMTHLFRTFMRYLLPAQGGPPDQMTEPTVRTPAEDGFRVTGYPYLFERIHRID